MKRNVLDLVDSPMESVNKVFYCMLLYCIVLYCIVLYCIVLYCIVIKHPAHVRAVFTSKFDSVQYFPEAPARHIFISVNYTTVFNSCNLTTSLSIMGPV